MASWPHEGPHLIFTDLITQKRQQIGISLNLLPVGQTKYKGKEKRLKMADSAYQPRSRKPSDWPMLVFECGYSESLKCLRQDSRWWLSNSDGKVKVVVLIKNKPAVRKLIIEAWEIKEIKNPRVIRDHPGPTRETVVCVAGVEISGDRVVGAPFKIDFEKAMLRKPNKKKEKDFVFTKRELLAYSRAVWRT